jgi:hypothetical protein
LQLQQIGWEVVGHGRSLGSGYDASCWQDPAGHLLY